MGLILREKCKKLFVGEVTLSKKELWVLAFVCMLFGIVFGLLKAPLTHGITISCGNNNGNVYGAEEKDDEADAAEA
ncbi:MAG: hypothetical protein NC337_04310 [Roseburia sp.]|nr:hypothetical protein [Roseburia sp.]